MFTLAGTESLLSISSSSSTSQETPLPPPQGTQIQTSLLSKLHSLVSWQRTQNSSSAHAHHRLSGSARFVLVLQPKHCYLLEPRILMSLHIQLIKSLFNEPTLMSRLSQMMQRVVFPEPADDIVWTQRSFFLWFLLNLKVSEEETPFGSGLKSWSCWNHLSGAGSVPITLLRGFTDVQFREDEEEVTVLKN